MRQATTGWSRAVMVAVAAAMYVWGTLGASSAWAGQGRQGRGGGAGDAVGAGRGGAEGRRDGPAAAADAEIHSLHVQGNVWMLVGGFVNAAIQVGDEGVLVVDTMTEPLADKMIAEIRRIAGDKPIRYVVNTHVHPDHTGGNVKVADAGESIVGGNAAGQLGPNAANSAQIVAHENVQVRMAKAEGAATVPFAAQPTDTFFTPTKEIYFNGEAVQLFHRPKVHTDGDVLVFFRKSDVVVAGDLFVTTTFPVISLQEGGSLNGIVDALNTILDLTVPRDKQEGGTYVIPGHGRLVDEADVVDYRDMVTIIRDRIRDAIEKGMTLEQVKAARLVRDYEGRFGATTGFWTTDNFIEAAYRSLSQK
jgi:cyclase